MRRGMILILLAALVALATSADARTRYGPGSVLRTVTAPVRIAARELTRHRKAHRRRHHKAIAARHHWRAVARSSPRTGAQTAGIAALGGPVAAAEAGEGGTPAATDQSQDAPRARPESAAWVGPLYWPAAPDDLFDYALRPASSGERFWPHGGRDLFEAMLQRSPTNAGWMEMCGSRRSGGPSSWQDVMAEAIQPSDAQRRILGELGSALVAADNAIKAACPTAETARAPERLDHMTDRLWAMRQATIIIRTPLEALTTLLAEEQKARLNAAASGGNEGPHGMSAAAPALCADPAAAMMPWPSERIERAVRPSSEQRKALQSLQTTTQGMAQLLMTSCPAETPAMPLPRLDAAEKRLNAMLYAARVVGSALHGFYDSLTEEQKLAFDALARQPRPAEVPAMARGR